MSDALENISVVDSNQEQKSAPELPVPGSSPGEILNKAREELSYGVEEVAEKLHMTARYVKALESNEYHILPGKTFVKGYVKAYAALLDVNVEKIMACYQQYSEALDETEESEAKVMRARRNYDQNKRWLIVTACIIVIVVAVSWWYR